MGKQVGKQVGEQVGKQLLLDSKLLLDQPAADSKRRCCHDVSLRHLERDVAAAVIIDDPVVCSLHRVLPTTLRR